MTTIAAKSNLAVAADLVGTDRMIVHRTGQASAQPIIIDEVKIYLAETYAGGLSGTGTTQSGATLLAANKNVATTVTGAANAFLMPSGSSPLYRVAFFNDDAADNAQLFPATGENLGAGVNASVLVAPGDFAIYEKKTATSWVFVTGTVSY